MHAWQKSFPSQDKSLKDTQNVYYIRQRRWQMLTALSYKGEDMLHYSACHYGAIHVGPFHLKPPPEIRHVLFNLLLIHVKFRRW